MGEEVLDTSGKREELERRALLAARALVDRMRTLYRRLEHRTRAPIAVHRALATIETEPGIAASRLALLLGMQRPALSQLLRTLVDSGWVDRVRDDTDHRSVRVYLTPAGRQLVGATSGRARGALQRAVRRLSGRGLECLTRGLEELLPHLPQAVDDVGMEAGRKRSPAVNSRATRVLSRATPGKASRPRRADQS